MAKIHFGTDGIRGKSNEELTVEMAYRMGQFLGAYYHDKGRKILIGRDTRLSGSMFEAALSAGITAHGADAYQIGICSTPELVYLVTEGGFDCGLMISASHNPFYDNGIKVITGQGTKMDAAFEARIEDYIYGEQQLENSIGAEIGTVIDYSLGHEKYFSHLTELFPLDLSDYHVVIDCANGSATVTALEVLSRLNCHVDVINNTPDGLNINRDCGSTHIENLVEYVKKGSYDAGFAYDGDADRVIAVARDGAVVDGDKIIYCTGKYFNERGLLRNGKVVTTVMANLGLFKLLDRENLGYEKTAVGDKYVYECMVNNDYIVGGEQSGHIIFKDYASTGDGLLTTLMLLKIVKETGKSLNELTDQLIVFPQILINVKVNDKQAALKDEDVQAECKAVEDELNGDGRVLVRASGTEPLIRVMVEASTDELCKFHAERIVRIIKEKNL